MSRPYWHIDELGHVRNPRGKWVRWEALPPAGVQMIDFREIPDILFRDGVRTRTEMTRANVVMKTQADLLHG